MRPRPPPARGHVVLVQLQRKRALLDGLVELVLEQKDGAQVRVELGGLLPVALAQLQGLVLFVSKSVLL